MTTGGAVTDATYLVSGMTCGHCVTAVSEEISAIPGVATVAVELVTGGDSRVMVTSAAPLRLDDVRAAVDEAGYTLAP